MNIFIHAAVCLGFVISVVRREFIIRKKHLLPYFEVRIFVLDLEVKHKKNIKMLLDCKKYSKTKLFSNKPLCSSIGVAVNAWRPSSWL